MRQYINTCARIEKTIARIYRILHESDHLEVKARQVFFSLANDEDDHAHQLEFALRLPNGSLSLENENTQHQAEALLKRAEEALQRVSGTALSIVQAVDLGLELENDFCSIHLSNSMKFKDESIRKMFSAMAKSEEAHKRKLLELKASF